MPKNDDLKNRLDELFSAFPAAAAFKPEPDQNQLIDFPDTDVDPGIADIADEFASLRDFPPHTAWSGLRQPEETDVIGYTFNRLEVLPISSESGYLLKSKSNVSKTATLSIAGIKPYSELSLQGQPIGVLGLEIEAGSQFYEEENEFLQAISEQVSQALERARLMEQTQRSAVELQAVADVGTATASILDPTVLLQSVVDLTKERFNLYHAHIYLYDEEVGRLNLAVGAGEAGDSMVRTGWSIPYEKEASVVSRAARTGVGQIVADVKLDPAFLPNPYLPDTRSELAVPLIVADQLLGVFDVQSERVGRFAQDDIRTFTTLSSQVGVALKNARLYAEQLETVERLRELDNMKSAFLANMSHELRTPLNSILGFAQVILEGLDGPVTETMSADLELIEKNGRHLLHLINDVLDLERIDAGRLSLRPEPTSIFELMEDVLMTNTTLAREKGLELELTADPSLDWVTMVDQVRMRQIFINLIGNAMKFTEAGGILIEMELSDISTDVESIQIHIRDTGIGIPEEKLEDIFEAFSQIDSSTTRKVGGTGLGLPISRKLLEMHGGRLWAESEGIGKGSTFHVELPVNRG